MGCVVSLAMQSELIGETESGVEAYDSQCPECGSTDVRRSDTYSLDEISSVSPWCVVCDYGWMESV